MAKSGQPASILALERKEGILLAQLRLSGFAHDHTLEKMCTAEGAGRHYDIDKAVVWID
ncbi:MAG: hypothetical protein HY897_11870 [Deltaproteobacteria bacterium]|nr:hypothetical protein [Deltaproteobacteria bacterium]